MSKYNRVIKGVEVDVYDILKAYEVTDPALQHLIKKALCAGMRGHKDRDQDLADIVESAKRAQDMHVNALKPADYNVNDAIDQAVKLCGEIDEPFKVKANQVDGIELKTRDAAGFFTTPSENLKRQVHVVINEMMKPGGILYK